MATAGIRAVTASEPISMTMPSARMMSAGIPVKRVVQQPKHAGSGDHAHHVGEVIGGEDASLFGFARFLLQKSVERDGEKAAAEPTPASQTSAQ